MAQPIWKIWCVSLLALCLAPAKDSNSFKDKRDNQVYSYVQIGNLYWFTENLRYNTEKSILVGDTINSDQPCGEFYGADDVFNVCPDGWRLPTEKEVKALIKMQKKKQLSITDTLKIVLCGRIDNGNHSRLLEQNTFWLQAQLVDGVITHWHTFGYKQELHSHNVVNAERQFPVRCVCEAKS